MEIFFFNREDITFTQSCDSRLRVFSALSLSALKLTVVVNTRGLFFHDTHVSFNDAVSICEWTDKIPLCAL